MNLYLSLGHIWTGTQADARAAQGGKDFESIDVPTDKAGLIAFLNGGTQATFRTGVEAPPTTNLVPLDAEVLAACEVKYGSAPYRNGDPTTIINGSRDPGART